MSDDYLDDDTIFEQLFLPQGRGTISLNSGAREMAAILDTALLQALLHTGQSGASVELLKGVNYCDVKICEEIPMKSKTYSALLELFKSNSMHHEALKLLNQLSEESKSNQSQTDVKQIFSPELIIEYLKVGSLVAKKLRNSCDMLNCLLVGSSFVASMQD